jgi:DNA-directed RNA polymerase subunit alpha
MDYSIVLPSQPRVVKENSFSGVFEIDGLYRGYGQTLGNSIRRIILSSLPGAAITSVKIDGIQHEFSTIEGMREDVVTMLLNLRNLRLRLDSDEQQVLVLDVKGEKKITGADFNTNGQVEILNPEQLVATLTSPSSKLKMEVTVKRGLGYVPKEILHKDKVDIGVIALDAIFSPVRRVNFEVENMRVGDRTDFNRLRFFIETDGSMTPRQVLERSIRIMLDQLYAILNVASEDDISNREVVSSREEIQKDKKEIDPEFLKTRLESLNLSTRTENSLINAGIRTVGGLIRKSRSQLLELEGLGDKALEEIVSALKSNDITLKD